MPLTLTIRNAGPLSNGSPLTLTLDRRGAMIGRGPTSDWCLPDPTLHISSRHCEIAFRGEQFILEDLSTNGTFLNGAASRLPGPHIIAEGDVLVIGQFEIVASMSGQPPMIQQPPPPAATPAWQGWGAGNTPAAPPTAASQWDAVPPAAAISGTGPMSQNWAPPRVEPDAVGHGNGASHWGSPPAPAIPASDWSSPITGHNAAPAPDDVWGKLASSNVVDWARGGFGAPSAVPTPAAIAPAAFPPPAGMHAVPAPDAAPAFPSPGPAGQAPASAPGSGGNLLAILAQATGLTPDRFRDGEAATIAQAGNLLRRIVSGLVVLLEARARAKSQMGAQGTSLEFDGNNPLKFARTPEQALVQLLNAPERGFMSSDLAIEDAFRDLQAHQIATLKAMQGALRATLDRFSPTAIRARAVKQGVLAKILPGARDAALWQTYEREFSGVARGSDEAFMDIFAKEFRKAYDEQARGGNGGG